MKAQAEKAPDAASRSPARPLARAIERRQSVFLPLLIVSAGIHAGGAALVSTVRLRPAEHALEAPRSSVRVVFVAAPETAPETPAPPPAPEPKAAPPVPDPAAARAPPLAAETVKLTEPPPPIPVRDAPVATAEPAPAPQVLSAPAPPVSSEPQVAPPAYVEPEATVTSAAEADAPRNPKPPYPAIARSRGWEGTVLVKVEVRADGSAGAVLVGRSSGYRVLDDAATRTLGRWKFAPARAAGLPVASWVEIPVRFEPSLRLGSLATVRL